MAITTARFYIPNDSLARLVEKELHSNVCIGHGTFARVFKACILPAPESTKQPHDIAIKVTSHFTDYIRARTLEEIRILKKIQGLPHVQVFIGAYVSEDMVTLTTTYVPGKTLQDGIIKVDAFFSSHIILTITMQIASGLDNLRDHKIIHGDLTPRNVLFDGRRATIIDFGLSTDLNIEPSDGHTMYPIAYCPPEMNIDVPIDDNSSDVWSLGILVYKVFTKQSLIQLKVKDETVAYNDVLLASKELLMDPPLELVLRGNNSDTFFLPGTNQFICLDLSPDNYCNPRKFDLIMDIVEHKTDEDPSRGTFMKNLLGRMICWEPKDRITPKEIIEEITVFEMENFEI